MTAEDIGAATARVLIEGGAIQISRDRPSILCGQAPDRTAAPVAVSV